MADPTKPREVGRWWIPGQNAAAGETPTWTRTATRCTTRSWQDDFAYGSWRDGGLTILDVKDKSAPKLIAHRNWCPPFGGGTHNAVPLHDRNLLVVAGRGDAEHRPAADEIHLGVRHPREEQSGQHRDDADAGGPGLREDGRPVRSAQPAREPARVRFRAPRRSSPPGRARACGCSTSPIRSGRRRSAISCRRSRRNGWSRCAGRAKVRHTADVFVAQDGLIYVTDYDAGLYILQWKGNLESFSPPLAEGVGGGAAVRAPPPPARGGRVRRLPYRSSACSRPSSSSGCWS